MTAPGEYDSDVDTAAESFEDEAQSSNFEILLPLSLLGASSRLSSNKVCRMRVDS